MPQSSNFASSDKPQTLPEPSLSAVEPMTQPADGVPDVVDSTARLRETAAALAEGHGPIAVDAERASGHRYDQRAFLVQLRREGSGTHLIDPPAINDTSPLSAALSADEWILHAATQDLPCLRDLGLNPPSLFDTELAGRLLGLPRVGLAGMTEDLLGIGLAKQHSAADWSRRPLPKNWLAYAALDVELLLELRAVLTEMLQDSGRWPWAEQEFDYLLQWQPKERPDPWRRLPGVSRLSDVRDLAIARELWRERDQIAQRADQPPGRILPNPAVAAAVKAAPATEGELKALPEFKNQRRALPNWWRAIVRARQLPEDELPPLRLVGGIPHHRNWNQRRPEAARLLGPVREAVSARADELGIAHEVLISPDAVRSLIWEYVGTPVDEQLIADHLMDQGAREWQLDLVLPVVSESWLVPD